MNQMINNSQINIINDALLKYAPDKIALFGSRARGDGNENSDLDILVFFKQAGKSPYSILELLSVEQVLATKLGFPVEIVNEINIKNSVLKQNILNDLVIIYQQV